MKKKNIITLLIINILIILISAKTNIFGSTMDFLNQHIIFPDYLRNTFYETGRIIPKLAINLGAGQNIYNIAYYGLLNPIIMLSYLFPFIKMIDYIIIINIVLLVLSSILFYKFVSVKFDDKISLLLSVLFTLSGPLIFQFHRHFMFVNYIPFLMLSLINIDKNKKLNLIIDIFLIIMISFYYSIPSIITILIYYIYVNFDKFKSKEFIKFIMCIITSILLSMILLLPMMSAILETRSNPSSVNILSLLIPSINIDNILYGAYAPGLTSICIISLIYLLITRSKKNIFLFIWVFILSFIPLSLYLLNGGLYFRSKALIPLLPLLVLIIGIFIKDLFDNKVDIKKLLVYVFIGNLIILIKYHVLVYYLDLLFMIILMLIYYKTKHKKIFVIPLVLLNVIICLCLNGTENYISKDLYNQVSKPLPEINTNYRTINLNNKNETVNKIYNHNYYTTSIYSSTINKYYSNLYHNVFKMNNSYINNLLLGATDNVLFNKYMGVKYIVGGAELDYPYKKVSDNLYELDTNPIGYVTSHTINKEYYNSLEYPYNLDILLNYIVDENSTNKPLSKVKKIDLDFDYELGNSIRLDGNKMVVLREDKITVHLKENFENKILFINIYGLTENDKDIKMTINGQANLLTKNNWLYPNHNNVFHYCLNNVKDTLEILLTPGTYYINDIELYLLDNTELFDVDEFNITTMNSEVIKGNIDVTRDGVFVLKIPYDKGFNIKVNGKNTDYKLINDAFIGFDLNEGNYDIEITYNPPYLNEGKILSIIGFGLFIIGLIYKKVVTNKNYKIKP